VRGVAQGVEATQNIGGDLLVAIPDVRHRHADELGERPVAVDPDPSGGVAQVSPAGQAVAAAPAHHMSLGADQITHVEIVHVAADLDDPADELVADHHRDLDRLLGPGVPVVDVHVRAADRGLHDFDQHVVDIDSRLRHVLHPEADLCLAFDQRFHERFSKPTKTESRPRASTPRKTSKEASLLS